MAQDPFEVAKGGGLHSGLIKRFGGETEYAIRKSIDSLRKQVELHRRFVADPWSKVDRSVGELAAQRLTRVKWPEKIERLEQEIEVLKGFLRGRT